MTASIRMGRRLRDLWQELRREPPPRPAVLNFALPALQRGKARPELRLAVLQEHWQERDDSPLLLLGHLGNHLSLLNRCALGARRRWALLEAALRAATPVIAAAYARQSGRDGFPESVERRESLCAAIEVVRQLTLGYKRIFKHDYAVPDFRYALVRARLQAAGQRILELIRAEQRLCALRYQKLAEQAWRDANQVYFVLDECEDVEVPGRLAGCLPAQLRDAGESPGGQQFASARQLYVSIQLLGLLDTLTWPAHQMRVVDAYLRLIEPRIELRREAGDRLPSGHVLVYRDHGAAPLFAIPLLPQPGLVLDIRPLLQQLRDDLALLGALDQDAALGRIAAPLSVLAPDERQRVVEQMLYRLHPCQRRDTRIAVNHAKDLCLYAGFMDSYRFVQGTQQQGAPDGQRPARPKQRSLQEMLSGRSAPLAERRADGHGDDWFVVNESEGGLQLRTPESPYSTPFVIGQLVTLHYPGEGPAALELGYIGRLHRSRLGELEVTVIKLSSYAEAIAVQDAALHRDEQALPAVLIRNRQGRWQLVMHARQALDAGSRLMLRRGERVVSAVLGMTALQRQQFSVFDIQAGRASGST